MIPRTDTLQPEENVSETCERVTYANVEGADAVFTAEFLGYFVAAHDKFVGRVHDLLAKRAEVLRRALEDGVMPAHPPVSEINTTDWSVPPSAGGPATPWDRDHRARRLSPTCSSTR